jgi:DNA-binding transcriptional LysR family regulator
VAPIESHLRARGIEPRIVFRSDDYGTVEALVATGMGAALVPRLTVTQGDPRVTILPLDDDLPARRVGLVWHRDRHRSPAARAFVAETEQVCGDLRQNVYPDNPMSSNSSTCRES